jgi:hypothetical protein
MEATVIIPTHDHQDTLLHSIASAQAQTVRDIQIFVIGDGAPDRTREIVTGMASADARIRYFEFPKGPRCGEIHRAPVLSEARGRCVCYLCDDDLWMPTHVGRMCEALADADFAHCMGLSVPENGEALVVNGFDLGYPADRIRLTNGNFGFGLSCGAHTLESYRRLPRGWCTAPAGLNTDVHMWRQFLEQPWCRAVSLPFQTVLKFSATGRKTWSVARRTAELAVWRERIGQPGFAEKLSAQTLRAVWRQRIEAREFTALVKLPIADRFIPYELGRRVSLALGGDGRHYLSWGWAEGEPWGRWSDGPEARMLLQLPEAVDGELELEAGVRAFTGPGRPVSEVDVVCNGVLAGTWVFTVTQPAVRTARLRGNSRNVDLRFLFPGVTAAAKCADTPDLRRIALGVEWIELRSVSTETGERTDPVENLDRAGALSDGTAGRRTTPEMTEERA